MIGTTSLRDHVVTIVVAALSSLFAATLILGTGVMTAAIDPGIAEESMTFKVTLLIVSSVFILIALYVGAIVTANTFSTIIAGRTRVIALLRLVGATSRQVRSRVALQGLFMGALGAIIGLGIATLLVVAFVGFGPALGWLPAGRDYPLFDPLALFAAGVVAATTWVAAWAGSRRVAAVSPIEATGAAVELTPEAARGRSGRTVWSTILLILGGAFLALGLLLGLVTTGGLLVAFLGGLLSFSGIALGAHRIMPPLLGLTGKLFRGSPVSNIATANAVRFPERSARATIGLVIGVTLVTMFAVALASYESMSLAAFSYNPALEAALKETLSVTSAVFTGLVGFSAIIAGIGMANTLSLGVMQRTREFGLLRTLGFTGRQVRGMVFVESIQMTVTALVFGLLLGTFYGWIAAQSLMGSQVGIMPPTVPWVMLGGVVVCGGLLAWLAAAAPAQRAVQVSPVEALAAA